MKSTVADYKTRVQCGRVVCRSGLTIRIAAYPYDLKMSNGEVYLAGAGFDYTGLTAETGFSASVIDLDGFIGYAGVTRDMLQSGVFDGAAVYYFYTNFMNPVEDEQPHLKSVFGKTTIEDDHYRIEQMSAHDLLSQDTTQTYTAACAHIREFGGQGHGRCGVNVAAITVTGTVTHLISDFVIRDSSRGESAGRFKSGSIIFTSGSNTDLAEIKIRDYAADGTITLYEPPFYALTVGVTYTMIPGCDGSITACKGYGNILRRRGFDWIPLRSTVLGIGGQS